MMRLLLTLSVLFLVPGLGRSESVEFAYSWSAGSTYLSAHGPGPLTLAAFTPAEGPGVGLDFGSGTALLLLAPAGVGSAVPYTVDPNFGPTLVPVGNLLTTSTPGGKAGTFDFVAGLDLSMHLTDLASGESTSIYLGGGISGFVNPDLARMAVDSGGWFGATVRLGEHDYTVVLDPQGMAFPGPDEGGSAYLAHVIVDGLGDRGYGNGPVLNVAQFPEPSTLLLGAIALPMLGLGALRRRRAKR